MKKTFALILASSLAVSLSACSAGSKPADGSATSGSQAVQQAPRIKSKSITGTPGAIKSVKITRTWSKSSMNPRMKSS
ncbi:hypothetical protein [Paenibacillus hexagrammi]|uniref:Uncharacterized protein n=1 Tax=Paenibacillus hexagrammi TaxID=2908839 RepID=A0ABY3SJB5_9BACL|nr:hypothetical protein [Paenibacillus sp. YPD9-1]UJF33620.1 hypothetical protein L0M14_29760 [Paenibacillus sp. YPD9-1]